MAVRLTRVQQRMLSILSDGKPHTQEELQKCLADDLGDVLNIRPHISTMRKILRVRKQTVKTIPLYILVNEPQSQVDES